MCRIASRPTKLHTPADMASCTKPRFRPSPAGEMNDAGEVLLTLYEAIDSVAQVGGAVTVWLQVQEGIQRGSAGRAPVWPCACLLDGWVQRRSAIAQVNWPVGFREHMLASAAA